MNRSCPRDEYGRALIRLRLIAEGPKDLIGWIIRLRTNSAWNHIDAEDADGDWLGARARGGVARRPRDYVKPARSLILDIPAGELACGRFYRFLEDQLSKPYDFGAIAHLALGTAGRLLAPGRKWDDPASWYCFELIFAALRAARLVRVPDYLPIRSVCGGEIVAAATGLWHRVEWRFEAPVEKIRCGARWAG